MLDRESQIGSPIVRWSHDGDSFIIMNQSKFEEVSTFDHDVFYPACLEH